MDHPLRIFHGAINDRTGIGPDHRPQINSRSNTGQVSFGQ